MTVRAVVRKLDAFQQKHRGLAFGYAVVKKYNEDSGGYQAALLTYYGFLSLFPLLLVLTTILQLQFNNNPHLHEQVNHSLSTYFPLLGDHLQQNVHSMRQTGLGLAIGLLITLYGARGFADALRFALDNMWHVPLNQRPGFPKNIGQSFSIMLVGSIGFGITVAASSLTIGFSHAWWMKVLFNMVSAVILAATLTLIFRIATAKQVTIKDLALGAGMGAMAIQLLLVFGGMLVSHELKGLNSLYGTFAVVLGLLFWLYLLAQVLVYAAEIDTVRKARLWPRSLSGPDAHSLTQRVASKGEA